MREPVDIEAIRFQLLNPPIPKTLDYMTALCTSLTGAEGIVIEKFVADHVVCIYAAGTSSNYWGSDLLLTRSVSNEAIKRGIIFRTSDVRNDPRVDKSKAQLANAVSIMVIPLYLKDRIYGIVKLTSTYPEAFDGLQMGYIEAVQQEISLAFYHLFSWGHHYPTKEQAR